MVERKPAASVAERVAKHRRGVRTDLKEIKQQLAELRRDIDARLAGYLDVAGEQQRKEGRRQ